MKYFTVILLQGCYVPSEYNRKMHRKNAWKGDFVKATCRARGMNEKSGLPSF